MGYAALLTIIVGTFWARKKGNSLLGFLRIYLRQGLRTALAILQRGTSDLQKIVS